ncbi:TetR/AcrR family transcriptional regulator, partial [Myxococcota bacterium]|nr:TetR/AcrR family transcriptional regulator [Myxococcota bacterium]
MGRPSNTDQRRAEITAALQRVMAVRGYDGASIADVAREAGLAPGLVHYHFANKLEILLALQAALVARHEAALDEALAGAGDDPLRAIGAFLDHHLALGPTADPDALACWVMLAAESIREPRVREGHAAALARLSDRLTKVLRAAANERPLTTKPAAAAAALLAAIQGYYLLAATAR